MIFFLFGYRINTFQVNYNEKHPLDGVIRYLQRETNHTFLNEIGVVTPTSNGTSDYETRNPNNIFIDESNDSYGYWSSARTGYDWFQLDFHQNAVLVTDYSIHAYGRDFLKEWKAYCSFDAKKWNQIDFQKESQCKSTENPITQSYHIADPLICRYFRLHQRDERCGNDNAFIIHKLDVFGIFYNYSSLLKMFQTFHIQRNFASNIFTALFVSLYLVS